MIAAQLITEDQNHADVNNFIGFSVAETGGANPTLIEFRLAAVGGALLAVARLAASESQTVVFPSPISTKTGVFVKTTGTGVVTGVLYGGQ